MRVEIIELLRCPNAHEVAALITVAHTRDGDRLLDGELGCAVCGAEFALRDGVVYLAEHPPGEAVSDAVPECESTAALLGLSEPGMRVLLCGVFGAVAADIDELTASHSVVANLPRASSPPRGASVEIDQVVLSAASRLPFADAAFHGVAIDTAHIALLADVARVVRAGGRVLAPVLAPVPHGCRELARDAYQWVAEVDGSVSVPMPLRRGGATWRV